MSIHLYATAMIGFEIPEIELYQRITIRHERHPVPPGANFCPICGMLVNVVEKIPLFDESNLSLGDFDLVFVGGKVYVGLKVASKQDGDSGSIPVPGNLSAFESELCGVLEEIGIQVDRYKFGLYAVLCWLEK